MPGARAGVPLEPNRLLIALRRGYRLIAAVTLLSGLGGVAAARTIVKREYEAQIVLQWEHGNIKGGDETRGFQTVLDSVKLPGNLEKVRERLGLTMTLEMLGQRVKVASSEESDVLTLKATAEDGEAAARLAEAVTTAFLEHRREVERTRIEEQARVVSENVSTARQALTDARRDYHDLLVQNGVADLDIEVRAGSEEAARLRAEADLARAEADAELARVESLQRVARAEQPTTVLQEKQLMPGARKLVEAQAELAALRGQLSEDHPRVLSLSAQIDALERRATAAEKVEPSERTVGRNPQWDVAQQNLTSALAQREAAIRRQLAYEDLLARSRSTIARLAQLEGEASKRLTAIHAAEKHLTGLQEQLAKVEDAARSPSSDIRILAPAKVPPFPSKSRRMLVALLSPAVGLVLAALFVLCRAVSKLDVRTSRELAFWGRAPVVAASTWPRVPAALDELCADLAASQRRAGGSTLLVGCGDREARRVAPLARGLAAQAIAPREGSAEARAGATLEVASPDLAGTALRRAARKASRVLMLVEAGQRSALEVMEVRDRLGRDEGIGFVLLGLDKELDALPDRAGDTERFWRAAEKR